MNNWLLQMIQKPYKELCYLERNQLDINNGNTKDKIIKII